MKIVVRTVILQFSFILLFGIIYLFLKSHFVRDTNYTINKKNNPEIIDCFFLSTTIQSGVGYGGLYPITNLAKSIMIIQQLIMISINILLLYVFTTKELSYFWK